jgi:hypothetical protein
MKKQGLKSIVAVSFLFALGVVATPAQVQSQIAVSVPFDFYVKNQKLAAGEYRIESLNPRSNQPDIVIRQKNGRVKELVMMLRLTLSGAGSDPKPRLVFNRYGSNYFLSEITNPTENFSAHMPKSKVEKTLTHQFGKAERETIRAGERAASHRIEKQ